MQPDGLGSVAVLEVPELLLPLPGSRQLVHCHTWLSTERVEVLLLLWGGKPRKIYKQQLHFITRKWYLEALKTLPAVGSINW